MTPIRANIVGPRCLAMLGSGLLCFPDLRSFNDRRALYIFGGQFTKRFLRLGIADFVSVPLTLVGLMAQINRASGHGVAFRSPILARDREIRWSRLLKHCSEGRSIPQGEANHPARLCYRVCMPNSTFRCPYTGMNISRPFPIDPAADPAVYEAVQCPACGRLHLINKLTGKLLSEGKE